jgi:hypothetical protein
VEDFMKKAYFSVLVVFSVLVCVILGLFVSCTSVPKNQIPTTNSDAYVDLNQRGVFDHRLEVYDKDDKLLFELIGIKDVLIYTHEKEEIELIEFETSTGIDFVKVCTENSTAGIRSEYVWANYTYPEFKRQRQSLISIKINELLLPCDLLSFKNNETGEEKEIYFEIADFFGKW